MRSDPRHGTITTAPVAGLFWPCLLLAGLMPACVHAQAFSALVTPPRIEDTARAGETYRNIVEINNVSAAPAHFTVRTADWVLQPDGGVAFSQPLSPGSCRPWVGMEAPEITIGANGKRRYRFEVAVPADAPSGECRFAIMIQGDAKPVAGKLRIPVSGRIGVIVYLAIGDAGARLQVAGHGVKPVQGADAPVISVHNAGNAHGRLAGFIDGTDATGKTYAFAPDASPVLAGETRDIKLVPQPDDIDGPVPVVVYPLHVHGRLDWGSDHFDLEATFQK